MIRLPRRRHLEWDILEGRRCPTVAGAAASVAPVERTDGYEVERHAEDLAQVASGQDRVVFLGDSITDWWGNGSGASVWSQQVAPLGAADFGVVADTAEDLLWRIDNGELAGKPKVAVVEIGTNDLGEGRSDDQTVASIQAVVRAIQTTSPTTQVVLMGLFPRGASATDPLRLEIGDVNAQLGRGPRRRGDVPRHRRPVDEPHGVDLRRLPRRRRPPRRPRLRRLGQRGRACPQGHRRREPRARGPRVDVSDPGDLPRPRTDNYQYPRPCPPPSRRPLPRNQPRSRRRSRCRSTRRRSPPPRPTRRPRRRARATRAMSRRSRPRWIPRWRWCGSRSRPRRACSSRSPTTSARSRKTRPDRASVFLTPAPEAGCHWWLATSAVEGLDGTGGQATSGTLGGRRHSKNAYQASSN